MTLDCGRARIARFAVTLTLGATVVALADDAFAQDILLDHGPGREQAILDGAR